MSEEVKPTEAELKHRAEVVNSIGTSACAIVLCLCLTGVITWWIYWFGLTSLEETKVKSEAKADAVRMMTVGKMTPLEIRETLEAWDGRYGRR